MYIYQLQDLEISFRKEAGRATFGRFVFSSSHPTMEWLILCREK